MRTTLLLCTVLATSASADVAVRERGGHWTEATVILDAPPAEAYAIATDYANWQRVFSDVTAVSVERGGREDARVRFTSRALDHTVTVQFSNIRDRAIRFHGIKGPPGGRARGEYLLEPIDGGTRTRVLARLYVNVVGVAALVVREGKVRPMREAKLRADLDDMARWASRR